MGQSANNDAQNELEHQLKQSIRVVPDFPKKGIQFYDITSLWSDPQLNDRVCQRFIDIARIVGAESIVGIDARGFVFGAVVAAELSLPFVPVRKAGKLPAQTEGVKYSLEYGMDELQIHTDAPVANRRVMVIDDLLATGGTALATCQLVEKIGGTVATVAVVIDLENLSHLPNREKLSANYTINHIMRAVG